LFFIKKVLKKGWSALVLAVLLGPIDPKIPPKDFCKGAFLKKSFLKNMKTDYTSESGSKRR